MEPVTLKARLLPRDVADGLVSGGIGFAQVIILFVVPALVVAFVAQSTGAGVLTFFALYVLWLLFTVRHLRCDAEALEFVRALGSPKRIPWQDLDSVEEVPRKELVVRGWLWPPFPAREMTPSLTSTGHYRVRWRGKDAYFPPKDAQAFLEVIQRGRAAQGVGADERRHG